MIERVTSGSRWIAMGLALASAFLLVAPLLAIANPPGGPMGSQMEVTRPVTLIILAAGTVLVAAALLMRASRFWSGRLDTSIPLVAQTVGLLAIQTFGTFAALHEISWAV